MKPGRVLDNYILVPVLVIAGLILAWVILGGQEPARIRQGGTETPEETVGGAPGNPGAADVVPSTRDAIPVNGAAPLLTEAVMPVLVVRSRDESPVAEAAVEIAYRAQDEMPGDPSDSGAEPVTVAEGSTDLDGRCRFDVVAGRRYRLRVRAEGFAVSSLLQVTGGVETVVRLSEPASIQGVVIDAASDVPVRGARVSIQLEGDDRLLARATSDHVGRFCFEGLDATTFILGCRSGGYVLQDEKYVMLIPGEDHFVEFRLEHGRDVEGHVFDAVDRHPLVGAEVWHSHDPEHRVLTDTEGAYRLNGLPGTAFLDVSAPGHARVGYSVVLPHRKVQDFYLPRSASISGRVVDEEGAPVASATVSVFETPGTWLPGSVDANGWFTLEGKDPGRLGVLVVRASGFGTRFHGLPTSIPAGQTLDIGILTLRAPVMIQGRVESEDGKPAAGVWVSIAGANDDFESLLSAEWKSNAASMRIEDRILMLAALRQHPAMTAPDGSFRFGGLSPGSYLLTAEPRADNRWGGATLIRLHAGMPVHEVKLTLEAGLSISGHLRRKDGQPLPDMSSCQFVAMVLGGHWTEARIGPTGAFRFEGLDPGRFSVTLRRPPAGWALPPVRDVPAGTEGLNLTLEPALRITGRVVDTDHRPVEAFIYNMYEPWWLPRVTPARTREGGTFVLEVPSSFHGELYVSPLDSGLKPVRLQGILAGTTDLEIVIK
ncbi:MAG: carboxypeptidase-like regulatory domain-containing protein [Planctomycetota bacterium]